MRSVGLPPVSRRDVEDDLHETVRLLFERLRGLAGFSVLDARAMAAGREAGRLEGDLCLADITLSPGFTRDYFGDIAIALVDLMEERPDARELLRGRTFARAFH